MDPTHDDRAQLRADIARLEEKVRELEQGQTAAATAARQSAALLRAIIDNAPMLIYAMDVEGHYILANQHVAAFLKTSWEALEGKTEHDVLPKELADVFRGQDLEVIRSGSPLTLEDRVIQEDGAHEYITIKFPLHDAKGETYAVCGISTDITERVRAEVENRRLQEEMLRVQDETLRALSIPLIPIADGVLVMPLIGAVSSTRAQQVLETLLRGISEHRARIVILDLTGMPAVGAEVGSALIKAARAVALLGAEIVLTGIQPDIARTLIDLGTDLSDITTRGTVQSGVAYALHR